MGMDAAYTITSTGTTVTTGAGSARVVIPNNSAGASVSRVRYIRVAATVESYVKVGDVNVVATTNDILVQPADSIILNVPGCTNIAYIQGTSTGKVNIMSLDDE